MNQFGKTLCSFFQQRLLAAVVAIVTDRHCESGEIACEIDQSKKFHLPFPDSSP